MYLVCVKESDLRRPRNITPIYFAFHRLIQHEETKEWQLGNCVNRNFNPSIKSAGEKQLITLDKLMIDTSNQDTSRQYLFWKAQFNNYCNYTGASDEERLGILVGKIEVNVYDYIEGIDNINDALVRLDEVFKKKPMKFLHAMY